MMTEISNKANDLVIIAELEEAQRAQSQRQPVRQPARSMWTARLTGQRSPSRAAILTSGRSHCLLLQQGSAVICTLRQPSPQLQPLAL